MNTDDEEPDVGESTSNELLSISSKGIVSRNKKNVSVGICTTFCRYDVVRKSAFKHKLRDVTPEQDWTFFWTDYSVTTDQCLLMKHCQRINHFPGMAELCRKDILTMTLKRFYKIYPREFEFFPNSWCLPMERADLLAHAKRFPYKTYILKPNTGCQGKGITLTRNVHQIPKLERLTCQEYVSRPLLIDQYKFDLRVYCLITSCFPLRMFVYNDGLVRFATLPYTEPRCDNSANMFMHLTNYAVNRNSKNYLVDNDIGTKRKISTLYKWFQLKSFDCNKLRQAMDEIVVKTTLAAQPSLKKNYLKCFPHHCHSKSCFQLLGYDILLDEKLKPFLLEVNHSPSFHIDSQVDKDIKERLLYDVFQMLNLSRSEKDCEPCIEGQQICPSLEQQIIWESKHKGNFRQVYPRQEYEKYEKFINHQTTLLEEGPRIEKYDKDKEEPQMERQQPNQQSYLHWDNNSSGDPNAMSGLHDNGRPEKEKHSVQNSFIEESNHLIDLVFKEFVHSRNNLIKDS